MRISEAALALITRVNALGETEYLTQWNEKWQAYSLIGGHREEGESFRECCIREVEEELELQHNGDFLVSPYGSEPLEREGFSQAAGVETRYRFVRFHVDLNAAAMAIVTSDRHNRWLSGAEILSGTTWDRRPIAEQVLWALEGTGLLT